jgi:transcriptional regulator with XRE-family HTH domain
MSIEKTNRISGGLLRHLRESQSMDIARLARQVNLSVAQLKQLESDDLAPGERALFYSETIKANAAKKVAQALGADLNELIVPSAPETALGPDLPDMQVLDDLAQLLQKQERARQASRSYEFLQSRRLWATVMLFVAGAFVWYFQKPLLAQGHDLVVSVERHQAPPVVLAAQPASEPASEPVVAVQRVTTPEQAPTVSSAEALCTRKASGAALKAWAPSKAGNMVHLVAQDDAAVCVQDATGKKFPVNFKAHESRTLYGVAPWTVHLDKAASVQVFFQGQRLRWPEGEQTSFTLQETPGTY